MACLSLTAPIERLAAPRHLCGVAGSDLGEGGGASGRPHQHPASGPAVMRPCVVLFSLAVLFCGCGPQALPEAKESVSVPTEKKADGRTYAMGSSVPFTGEVVTFTKGINRLSVHPYQDGKPHGSWSRYWSNGKLKSEERREQGELVHLRQWYEDGVLKQDTEMKNGLPFGKVRLWWPDGRVRRSSLIGDNLRPHGNVLEYARDGSLLTDAIFEHGHYVSGKLRKAALAPTAPED